MLAKQIPFLTKVRSASKESLSSVSLLKSSRVAKKVKNSVRSFSRITDILYQDFDFKSAFNDQIIDELDN